MNWMEKLLNTGSHFYHMSTHTHIHTYLSTHTYMYTQKTHTLFSLNLFIQDGNLHRAGRREEGGGMAISTSQSRHKLTVSALR